MLLSKSDFTASADCLAKLYFKKHQFPSNLENGFMASMARVGHMVGFLAKVVFPGGREISMAHGAEAAAQETADWIASTESGILYEATFLVEGQMARVDVLRKRGSVLEVIEVKSSGYDSTLIGTPAKEQVKKLEEKLVDLTFQTLLVERAQPEFLVEPALCLLDRNAVNQIEGLYGNFRVVESSGGGRFRSNEVFYDGDLEALRAQELLVLWPCKKEVSAWKVKVRELAAARVQALKEVDNFEAFRSPRSMACAKCAFNMPTEPNERNGFAQCWGKDASEQPHIFDIRRDSWVSQLLNPHVEQGLSRLDQVPLDLLQSKNGPRVYGMPLLQVQGVQEYWAPEGKDLLDSLDYPLYFIDFEAIRTAIPYHAGMSPYRSIVLFQWSCHRMAHRGAPLEHFAFLNTDPTLPNERFVRALKEVLGSTGTVLTWSSYENTQLRNILAELLDSGSLDHDLTAWLQSVLKEKDGGWRQVDLHDDVVKKFYYHRFMKNRTSIKVVLPAILLEPQPQANIDLLQAAGLYQETEDGGLLDPYKLLPGVHDGTEAMTAYDTMLYGAGATEPKIKEKLANELLEYCKLDTLSMVVIFNYLMFKK